MELNQLRQFVAAAESESFTRGAERAFVSQPALSASISRLEEELGNQLFIRNKRNVVLTPAGLTLLKRARLILGECAQAKAELKRHEVQRSLRLGVINTLSVRQVALLIEQYRRDNPQVALEVSDASQDQIEKLQKEARIDVALTRLVEGKGQNGQQQVLFREPYLVALPPGHHLAGRKSLSLAELAEEPFIARTHCESRAIIGELLQAQGVRLKVVYKTSQDDRAIALVEAGVGFAILPRHYASASFATVSLAEALPERQIGFVWVGETNLEEIRKFVDFARTVPWTNQ